MGSDPPPAPPVDSRRHWQRVQQGHAAANLMPLIASNRIGVEHPRRNPGESHIRFYGSSFIADQTGGLLAEGGDSEEGGGGGRFDRQERGRRRGGGLLFRDRPAEAYVAGGALTRGAR